MPKLSRLQREEISTGRLIAGHWKHDLTQWKVCRTLITEYRESYERNHRVPTWSWAHWNKKVKWDRQGRDGLVTALSKPPKFRFRDREQKMQSRQIFAVVSGAAIKLNGYLQKADPVIFGPWQAWPPGKTSRISILDFDIEPVPQYHTIAFG